MIEFAAGFILGAAGLAAFLNTNAILQFSSQFIPAGFSKAVFSSSLSFSKIVFDLIPSIFFFIPSSSYGVSILPAQRLYSQGKGYVLLKTMLACFFCSMLLSILFLPLVLLLMPLLGEVLLPHVGWALAVVVALSLFSREKKAKCLFAFLLSGALGVVLFAKPFMQEPLFPLLSGLFGIPAILFSSPSPAKQHVDGRVDLDFKVIVISVFLGAFSSLLPAMSPVFLVSLLVLVLGPFGGMVFMQSAASVLVSKTFFDFVAFTVFGKARSGAVAFASAELSSYQGLALALIAGAASLFLAIAVVAAVYKRVGVLQFYAEKTPLAVLSLLAVVSFAVNGYVGLFALAASASVGACIGLLGVDKTTALGSLMLPALFFFFA